MEKTSVFRRGRMAFGIALILGVVASAIQTGMALFVGIVLFGVAMIPLGGLYGFQDLSPEAQQSVDDFVERCIVAWVITLAISLLVDLIAGILGLMSLPEPNRRWLTWGEHRRAPDHLGARRSGRRPDVDAVGCSGDAGDRRDEGRSGPGRPGRVRHRESSSAHAPVDGGDPCPGVENTACFDDQRYPRRPAVDFRSMMSQEWRAKSARDIETIRVSQGRAEELGHQALEARALTAQGPTRPGGAEASPVIVRSTFRRVSAFPVPFRSG